MTLADLLEPVFLVLSRPHSAPSARAIRETLGTLLAEARARAARAPALLDQFHRVEPGIILAIDTAARAGDWPDSARWTALTRAAAPDDPAESFFQFLARALDEVGPQADERLHALLTAVPVAIHSPAPAQRQLLARVQDRLGLDPSLPICPDAYIHTRTDTLSRPSSSRAVVFVAIGLVAVALIATAAVYRHQSARLAALYRQVIAASHAPHAPGRPEGGIAGAPEPRP